MQLLSTLFSLSLVGSSLAFPLSAKVPRNVPSSWVPSIDFWTHPYLAPAPTDSRGPCPALNTLANHGYINRNGRDISADSIFSGMLNAFGFNQSAVAPALPNSYTTCHYLTGQDCAGQAKLVNLTLLAEPHAAEHDHSLSRQDYKMAYAKGQPTDNIHFNATIFKQITDLIGDRTHVDFALANQIRLLRSSNAIKDDMPGWLQPEGAIMPVQAFELGFIFAAMADRTLPDADTKPQIRVDWWQFWFANEALPYALGWTPPNPPREIDFVIAAAGGVYTSKPSGLPSPLPSGALDAPGAPPSLPATPTISILPLATSSTPALFPFWPFNQKH